MGSRSSSPGASVRTRKGLGAGLVALVLSVAVLAGCSSSDSGSAATTTTTAAPKVLKVLVTNDDGVKADGIDAVVEGLRKVPNVEVTVVAPAENQSGKGSAVTGGTLVVTDSTTKSGYPAKAVTGTPADTIVWAIDQKGISFTPDIVISGVNAGANMGPAIALSGTVGAARAAVARNIPAVASSNGAITGPFDFATSAAQVVKWFDENRAAIESGSLTTATVFNLNVPTCATGTTRGTVETRPAATADGYNDQPVCTSTAPNPGTDIGAYLVGFVSLANISPAPGAAN